METRNPSIRKKTQNEIRILEGVSLTEYYNENVVGLKNKFKPMEENDRVVLCPFHDDNTPSLYNWKKRNIFHCFACGFGGDVVRVHRQLQKDYYNKSLTVKEAVIELSKQFGVSIDEFEGFETESVFARAKKLLSSKHQFEVPKQFITLGKFNTMNMNIKKMPLKEEDKIKNYAELDLLIATQYYENKK